MRRCSHITNIGSIRINTVSQGASINYGPTIHKGHQGNQKIVTGEYIIGDEFNFNFGTQVEENNEENEEENNNINVINGKVINETDLDLPEEE